MANYSGAPPPGFKAKSMDERRDAARALLAQAGFGPDKPLTFTYRYMDSINGRRLAVALQDMWKEIGCEVTLIHTEARAHYDALRAHDFDLASAGWVADYDDAENYLFLLQSSSGAMNYSDFNNTSYDALMARAADTQDLQERAHILEQAEEIVLDETPLIPEYYESYRALVKPYVKGWVDNLEDWHRTRFLRLERKAS